MNKRFILPLLALLVFLTFALYWNLFVTNQATVAARLLINILTPLNSLLILILVFLLSRTLIKLYLEHRGKKAGFRLRTKLVLSILPLTLVPGLMMLLFSYQLPEQIISNLNLGAESDQFYAASRKLSDAYLHDVSTLLASHGPSIENLLTSGNVPNKLDQYIQSHRLDGVEIYQNGTLRWRSIARGLKPLADRIESSARYFTVPGPNPARWEDGFYLWRFPYNHNEWTLHFLFAKPEDFSANLVYLNNSLDAYAILERKKDDVANLYQSTLLVGTFAVIFGGIWMGMTFSRTFLKAFNTLSEGARKVESGELDTKIDLQTGDEIEEVGHAFNN
ncbi:MAG: HAMP domain-containing protein, partial [Acidobacteria bacterium]|nr:HAMP domain-containing protein [Acidobacteriota bacterium]